MTTQDFITELFCRIEVALFSVSFRQSARKGADYGNGESNRDRIGAGVVRAGA